MKYGIYKLKFPYGVHFGDRSLDTSLCSFCADTFFSSLCIDALKNNEDTLNELVEAVNDGKLVFSDALPFVGDDYLLPKPNVLIIHNEGDSVQKKKFKKIKYVSVSDFPDFISGNMNPDKELNIEKNIGVSFTRTVAAVRREDETLPYRIGVYRFAENAGLYILYGYETDSEKYLFYDLLDGLSFSGIGGKRSSGLGRYEIYDGKVPELFLEGIERDSDKYMALSICLPRDDELQTALEGANYKLVRRSGFVESRTYADSYLRKKDLYMIAAGSVFENRFSGDVYDVSSGGRHPVYRYGKSLLIGV